MSEQGHQPPQPTEEELQAVPDLPAKVGRALHGHLHRAG